MRIRICLFRIINTMTNIPAFHISSRSKARGKGQILISSRQDAVSSGVFKIVIDVQFDPATDDYPLGSIKIETDMSDSFKGLFSSSSIELINSYGKQNPTICFTGRCKTGNEKAPKGLRYWVVLVDNRGDGRQGTPDVVGFVIHDRNGNRVAYGTGPLQSGNIEVAPN
jgi:hypothetical protein